jgi:hypothetical protein
MKTLTGLLGALAGGYIFISQIGIFLFFAAGTHGAFYEATGSFVLSTVLGAAVLILTPWLAAIIGGIGAVIAFGFSPALVVFLVLHNFLLAGAFMGSAYMIEALFKKKAAC